MDQVSTVERPKRREYSVEFKASVLEQCRQPGASLAGIALGYGINPNMVHRWIREERQRQLLINLQQTASAFVPLQLQAEVLGRLGYSDNAGDNCTSVVCKIASSHLHLSLVKGPTKKGVRRRRRHGLDRHHAQRSVADPALSRESCPGMKQAHCPLRSGTSRNLGCRLRSPFPFRSPPTPP
jgi:transposase-like protein